MSKDAFELLSEYMASAIDFHARRLYDLAEAAGKTDVLLSWVEADLDDEEPDASEPASPAKRGG